VIVTEVLERDGDRVRLVAQADDDLAEGTREVRVASVSRANALVAYRSVTGLRVQPSYAIARLGGGRTPPVPAQFEAIGFAAGPDGEAGTGDDLEIGRVDARWRLEPYDELAAEMKDVDFSGTLDQRGRFDPAKAGPNPERRFQTNNAGRLKVVAQIEGNDAPSGSAELVVTVQRWVDPIIR
jgi:quinohemoprotein amine dehydrogenase